MLYKGSNFFKRTRKTKGYSYKIMNIKPEMCLLVYIDTIKVFYLTKNFNFKIIV